MNNSKTLSEKLAPFCAFGILLVIIWALSMSPATAQSFYAHRYHSNYSGIGQNIKTKTIGQKIRTKLKYAAKRHNNERFAFREMRRKSRGGRL